MLLYDIIITNVLDIQLFSYYSMHKFELCFLHLIIHNCIITFDKKVF